jgi:hypothetical protein
LLNGNDNKPANHARDYDNKDVKQNAHITRPPFIELRQEGENPPATLRRRNATTQGNLRKPLPAYFFAKSRRAASNLLARHKALLRRLSLLGKIYLRNPSEMGFRMSPQLKRHPHIRL